MHTGCPIVYPAVDTEGSDRIILQGGLCRAAHN